MTEFYRGYEAFLSVILIHVLLAQSQYLAIRSGLFSVATAGLAAFGAYTAGNLVLKLAVPASLSILAGMLMGAFVGLVLSVPLARLRGVFQAIATLAFTQIVLSVALWADPVTGGAIGLNGIPKSVEAWHLLLIVALVTWLLWNLFRSATGRALDTIRQDEHVAVAFGINVTAMHALAFTLSGAIAGLAGALMANHNFSVVAEEFGFPMLINALSFVVLGGSRSLAGPIVGAVILTLLPELARPLADNRMILFGALLVLVICYLPNGIADTVVLKLRERRKARLTRPRALPVASGEHAR